MKQFTMGRQTITALLVFSYSLAFAQLEYGFKPAEARDMIALCNSFTYLDLYDSDKEILPAGYKKEYTSGIYGMDNKFQVYTKGNIGVINLRGSTAKMMSWMENIYSAMISAQGVIKVQDREFEYVFAQDTAAAVHAGYALGIAYMSESLLMQVKYLNSQGIYDFILTGHSQGGALATMLRAWLENLPEGTISNKNRFKNYVFANPMVGNQAFVDEYNGRFATINTSFSIINPADPIPKLPITYSEGKFFSAENISSMLDGGSLDKRSLIMNLLMQKYAQNVTSYVQNMSHSLTNQIESELGAVEMPPYLNEINYKMTNTIFTIEPFPYPRMLKDSSILENDSLMAIYERDAEGNFLDEGLYQKAPSMWQHKPHNYYVGILKRYFPEQYAALPEKYLKENL